ncbi:MAG: hypothetical protein ACLFTK_06470 [Anaerolineales bacterium]
MHKLLRFVMLSVLAMAMLPVGLVAAQEETAPIIEETIIITEEQINDSFRVDNPRRQRVSDVEVDLQAPDPTSTASVGQAVVSGEYAIRRETFNFALTYVPYLDDEGRLRWERIAGAVESDIVLDDRTLESIDRWVEGQLARSVAEQYQIARDNVRDRTPRLDVTAVSISDTAITISYYVTTLRSSPQPAP